MIASTPTWRAARKRSIAMLKADGWNVANLPRTDDLPFDLLAWKRGELLLVRIEYGVAKERARGREIPDAIRREVWTWRRSERTPVITQIGESGKPPCHGRSE
jgi:hypothetical protein